MSENPIQTDFPMIDIENEDGWGPSEPLYHLQDLPLAGYMAKNDSLFNVADWYNTKRRLGRDNGPVNAEFGVLERATGYNYVASEPTKRKTTRRSYGSIQKARQARHYQRENQRLRREANKVETGARSYGGNAQARRNKWQKRRNQQYKARMQAKNENQYKFESSVHVQSTWGHKDDKWLPDMKEYAYELYEESYSQSLLTEVGRARMIKKGLPRVRVERPKKLPSKPKYVRRQWVPVSSDEILQMYESEGDVFICSEIMAALMVCPRSKMSFDILVTKKEDGKLWFDMRRDSPLQRPQPDEGVAKFIIKDSSLEKFMRSISEEAKGMSRDFHLFALDTKGKSQVGADGPGSRPLANECSNLTRYMKFELQGYNVICRCGIDAVDKEGKATMICCATQHNPAKSHGSKLGWKKNLDVKFAAVKTSLIDNNKFQFARWGIECVLSDIQTVVLGFAARAYVGNPKGHELLKVIKMDRADYLKRWVHLRDMENAWGILDHLIGYFRRDEVQEGNYCIIRCANKDRLSFYKIDDRSLEEQFV